MPAPRVISFELAARAAKAQMLADLLTSFGISSASARKLTAPQWKAAAEAAGCKPPNSELTRQAVYSAMRLTASESSMTVAQWKNHVEAQCQVVTVL